MVNGRWRTRSSLGAVGLVDDTRGPLSGVQGTPSRSASDLVWPFEPYTVTRTTETRRNRIFVTQAARGIKSVKTLPCAARAGTKPPRTPSICRPQAQWAIQDSNLGPLPYQRS